MLNKHRTLAHVYTELQLSMLTHTDTEQQQTVLEVPCSIPDTAALWGPQALGSSAPLSTAGPRPALDFTLGQVEQSKIQRVSPWTSVTALGRAAPWAWSPE